MKKFKGKFLTYVLASALTLPVLYSCGGDDSSDSPTPPPTEEKKDVTVSLSQGSDGMMINPSGQTTEVALNITNADGITPTVTSDADWCRAEIKNGKLSIQAAQNTTTDVRVATLTITVKDVKVTCTVIQSTTVASTEATTPPARLQTEPYVIRLTPKSASDAPFDQEAKMGFSGDDVYIQGLSAGVPEGWVKGKKAQKYIVIPPCNIGKTGQEEIFSSDVSFNGAVFIYDEATGAYVCQEGYSTTITGGVGGGEAYTSATMKKFVEVAVKPATPTCKFEKFMNNMWVININIPLADVNGNPIAASKLSYVVWYEKNNVQSVLTFTTDLYKGITENMTEIPYGFKDTASDFSDWSIFMNQGIVELGSWTRVGLQTIYRGGNAENKSDIAWSDMSALQNL